MEQVRIVKEIFQSTPPREGGDRWNRYLLNGLFGFQSTSPREGGDKVSTVTA